MCGSSLGRMEAKLALEELVTRVKPDYEIDLAEASRLHPGAVVLVRPVGSPQAGSPGTAAASR
jgi:hypothetical protein